jgi:hypothetical protein
VRIEIPRVPRSRPEEFALAAGEYVRRAVGVDLDGSVESLAFVDHYVAGMEQPSEEVRRLVAAAIGCYFGEVVIGRLGGRWEADDEDPARWSITVEAAPLSFRPVAMAVEAIAGGDVDDVDARMTTLPSLAGSLEEALAAAAPVPVDYYYSLTGRLETLEHAAELLVELRRLEHPDDGEAPEGSKS